MVALTLPGMIAQSDNGLSSNQRLIGHTTTDDIDHKTACFGQAGTYTIGAQLTAEELEPYVGCKVVGIRLAAGADLGRTKCHLQSVDGSSAATSVISQNQRLYSGWNNVFFNGNGYEIKAGESLFYGFDYVESQAMATAKQGAICVVGENTQGSFVLLQNNKVYPVSGGGKLCLSLIIDAGSLPANDLMFSFFDTGFKYKKLSEKFEVYAMLTATGRDAVTSFRMGYRFDDLDTEYVTVTKQIASGASDTWQLSIDLPAALGIGNHTFTTWMDAVNQAQLPPGSKRTATTEFGVYENTVPRSRVYVENYVHEMSPYATLFQDAMAGADAENAGKMSMVNVFASGSSFGVIEGEFLHNVYAYTIPSFTINRSYFPGEQHIAYDLNDYLASLPAQFVQGMLSDMILQDIDSPSFATVTVDKTSYDADTRLVTTTVSGQLLPESAAIFGELAVTLMMVQDSAVTGTTTFTNILRGYLGDPYGTTISSSSADTFTAEVSGTLPQGLDPEKMKIVAIIHKAHPADEYFNEQNARKYDVLNCSEARLSTQGGVTDVTVDRATRQVEAIYNLQGTRIQPKATLTPGLYIIRYTDGTCAKRLMR